MSLELGHHHTTGQSKTTLHETVSDMCDLKEMKYLQDNLCCVCWRKGGGELSTTESFQDSFIVWILSGCHSVLTIVNKGSILVFQ